MERCKIIKIIKKLSLVLKGFLLQPILVFSKENRSTVCKHRSTDPSIGRPIYLKRSTDQFVALGKYRSTASVHHRSTDPMCYFSHRSTDGSNGRPILIFALCIGRPMAQIGRPNPALNFLTASFAGFTTALSHL